MSSSASILQLALQRCSHPYGPYLVVYLSDSGFGVLPVSALSDPLHCEDILGGNTKRLMKICCRSTTMSSISSTPQHALLLVIELLQQEVWSRPHTNDYLDQLTQARKNALRDLWMAMDDELAAMAFDSLGQGWMQSRMDRLSRIFRLS